MRYLSVLTSVLLFVSFSFGQLNLPKFQQEEAYNYVPNPSFEETLKEPCGWNQGNGKFDTWLPDWNSATETTPDLFSTRVRNTCWSHPNKHSDNHQRPKEGDNMLGIKCYGTGGTDTYWHEYAQVELKETLTKDSLYYLEFYVNASHRASRICNNIGALVQADMIATRDRKPLYITPTINSDKMIKQSILGWKKINGVFKAKGDERFVVIGNFYRDEETKTERLETGRDGAYYYLDAVMLRKALPGEKLSPKPKESLPPPAQVVIEERTTTEEVEIEELKYDVGITVELRQIQFEFDKAELLPSSQKELNRLANILIDNPYMEIEVTGHTDNVGSEVYNQKLSESRAQAVVAYLLHKEVEKERLSFKGMGSIAPLMSNDTEEGQIANRRVEFTIIKN
jgi:outer membrane protein OmpA-like peptidoglycan-associated protein